MDRREIGRVVRVQVQLSSLKAVSSKGRYYDPTPLHEVEWLNLDGNGATALIGGEPVLDVHNSNHPTSKNHSGINDVSVGFTSHYERMRDRFDAHLVNGIAGENILIETDDVISLDAVSGGLVIEGDDGRRVELTDISVAHPCAEFSRFALNDLDAPPMKVSETLRFLENGLRGYYASVETDRPLRVELGDRVYAVRRD